ncbi:MAG: efflux transporter outer membrane subunit [Bacteroidota bacterium]
MRHLRYLPNLALLLSLFMAVSCKVGKNYQAPDFAVPEGYLYGVNETDSLGDIRWWELFNDPVLDTLIVKAVRNNQDLRIAMQSVEQAQLGLKIQRAELLPKISGQVNASRGNFQGFLGPSANTNWSAVGSLSWELDLWGKLRRLNEAALADYLSTEYGVKSVRLALVAEVASTYLLLREYQASMEISEIQLQLRDSSLRLVQARYDRGYAAEIDLNQAQIQRAIAASAVPAFNRLQLQAQNALSLLIGEAPQSILDSVPLDSFAVTPNIPVGLPSELLRRRPDLLEAEQFIVAQNALVGVAIGNRFPSLSLTGLLGVASGGLGDLVSDGLAWNVGGNLLGPIFHWDQNKRRVEIERSRLEQTYLSYERQVLNAFREVEDALVAIENYRLEVVARQQHVDAAINAQYLSSERYDRGVTSYLEYLESQRQAFEAQLGLVSTRRSLLGSYVQLYKAMGGGWITQEEEGSP